ncbi:hypothetical protein [Flexivirga caeni]|uniref:VOC family protein n=1 Tax=Flexivirga caeni TaxID=2294115 RepID=A0A3M9M6V9_9MICO|nr:hypothetical protein [Flexivirga caeni]RNI20278.1 hypothetical protein EFY87_15095 [Flexivirga caeni]
MTLFVQPIRFTDNVDTMAKFLAALGLSVSLTSDKGGWTVLAGATGTVALHSAADATSEAKPGSTSLSFEETALDELARRLVATGFGDAGHPGESMVYDEAYGRAISITLGGEELVVNGQSDDLYGYTSTGVEPGVGDLRVSPIRFVDDQGPDRRLLEALGFRVVGKASEHFTGLALPGVGGSVGLHPTSDEARVIPGPFAVQLSFETATPLAEVIERVTAVGTAATLHESPWGDHVSITDPDGQPVLVHAAPA